MRQWTAPAFLQATGAFWECFALHAALELDIFTPLADGPLQVEALAAKTGCHPRGIGRMVTALCALELLQRTADGTCALTPFARQYLCRDRKEYLGHIAAHHRQLVPYWGDLARAVREGTPLQGQGSAPTDDRESFLMGMRNIALAQAHMSVPHIDVGARRRLLDLGGGTGAYAVCFCREHPDMTATVFDQPSSRPQAEKVLAEDGMQERIRFVAGDFTTDAIPTGHDIAWLSQILHELDPETAALVVRRAGQALDDGGLLLIQEFMLEDDGMGPLFPALFSLNMLVQTEGGQSYSRSELTAFMRDAGAENIRVLPLDLPRGCSILAGEIRR